VSVQSVIQSAVDRINDQSNDLAQLKRELNEELRPILPQLHARDWRTLEKELGETYDRAIAASRSGNGCVAGHAPAIVRKELGELKVWIANDQPVPARVGKLCEVSPSRIARYARQNDPSNESILMIYGYNLDRSLEVEIWDGTTSVPRIRDVTALIKQDVHFLQRLDFRVSGAELTSSSQFIRLAGPPHPTDPMIKSIDIVRPNLVIHGVTISRNGTRASSVVEVRNSSDTRTSGAYVDVPRPFNVQWRTGNGEAVVEGTIGPLRGEEIGRVTLEYDYPRAGSYEMVTLVDSDDVIEEGETGAEGDNREFRTITVP
jgi:hypothetical protein